MNNNTPEFYGYTIGQNIVPYINKCIEETGECYISEGEHVFGRNDQNWNQGHIWSDSCITWGWNRKHDIKIIGAGHDKTILKLIDNVNSRYLFNSEAPVVSMISTNYNESCNNNSIEGITFDGNYDNNCSTSTICGIKIRGSNNKVENCRFINFAVGENSAHECFQVYLVAMSNMEKGPNIINNIFESVGKKKNSKAGHCPENTFIGASGKETLIRGNVFYNCLFDITSQQSPLHAITLADCINAEITGNIFHNFQGACIYMDSWQNDGVVIAKNVGQDVWNFICLACQKWPNPAQISLNQNFAIYNNEISLSNGNIYWQWDQPPIVSAFFVYNRDPSLDINTYSSFNNIVARNNKITLGYRLINNNYEESNKLICYWGNPVDNKKIFLTNNEFISTIPKPVKKESFFRKMLNWIINIFK